MKRRDQFALGIDVMPFGGGSRIRKTLLAGAVGLVMAFGVAGTTGAASAPGAAKLPLEGPNGSFFCAPPQSNFPIGDRSEALGGFVIYNYSAEDNTITAIVSIKGGAPNAEHRIFLIQNEADCFPADGVLTTNRQGNGTLTITEPAVSGSARVAVFADCLLRCNLLWSATESYSWS